MGCAARGFNPEPADEESGTWVGYRPDEALLCAAGYESAGTVGLAWPGRKR